MTRTRPLTRLALVCTLLVAPAASAVPPDTPAGEAAELFARLLRRNGAVRDFRATFRQQLVLQGLAPPPAESGEVFYLRPYRMRWEYRDPETKLAISDGSRGWLYLPDENRAVRVDLEGRLGGGPIAELLSGGDGALGSFTAELLPPERGRIGLRLVPVEPVEDFDALTVWAEADSLRLSTVIVDDPGGNRMIYSFDAMRENIGLPAELFTFAPPDGVEIAEW